jgi:hypothetical protein
MVMVIRYPDGSYVDGIIRRLEGGTVRAAIAGIDDAVDYTLIQDNWTSEMGLVVTFEFPIEMDRFQFMQRMNGEREAGCAAGGDCVLRRTSGSCAGPVN